MRGIWRFVFVSMALSTKNHFVNRGIGFEVARYTFVALYGV